MRYVAVSSNCQTGGLVACLKDLFPHDQVTALPLPWPFDAETHAERFAQQLDGHDFWVTIVPADACTRTVERIPRFRPKVLRIPAIGFSAFHPDLCYAQDKTSGALTAHHYNSAIAAWSYRNGLSPDDAARLFDHQVYADLGYLDQWAAGRGLMQQMFQAAGLEAAFEGFFRTIQRSGCFMHSINHPTIFVLEQLSKIVAGQMGARPEQLARPLTVRDGLTDTVWPLYPEVADALSLPGGNLMWKAGATHYLEGALEYVRFSFDEYARQGIAPENLQILHRDLGLLDRVLGQACGRPA
ncbi:MAG: hypothetical protein JSS57_05000 [Proteobacteria bacterium]|nr:hypothetical protein [Pseudomonadota bacterium]